MSGWIVFALYLAAIPFAIRRIRWWSYLESRRNFPARYSGTSWKYRDEPHTDDTSMAVVFGIFWPIGLLVSGLMDDGFGLQRRAQKRWERERGETR